MSVKIKDTHSKLTVQQPARRQLIQLAAMAGLGMSMGVSTSVQAQTPKVDKKAEKAVDKTKEISKKKQPKAAELDADKLKKGKGIDIPKP